MLPSVFVRNESGTLRVSRPSWRTFRATFRRAGRSYHLVRILTGNRAIRFQVSSPQTDQEAAYSGSPQVSRLRARRRSPDLAAALTEGLPEASSKHRRAWLRGFFCTPA